MVSSVKAAAVIRVDTRGGGDTRGSTRGGGGGGGRGHRRGERRSVGKLGSRLRWNISGLSQGRKGVRVGSDRKIREDFGCEVRNNGRGRITRNRDGR